MEQGGLCPPQGALEIGSGVRFRTWAPEHQNVEVVIFDKAGDITRTLPLAKDATGYHHAIDPASGPGTLYKYRLDGEGPFPDPASHFQPQGVHGPSQVVSASAFDWSDRFWRRDTVRVRDLVIYELHIGTFTTEGTFRAAIGKLDYLRKLGVTAVEIMPVGDFPGERNWGYDGVCLYAPAHAYGAPDDLRAFVDACHAHGLAVILDVVYNHFGPDGNYLGCYSAGYFDQNKHTPWGAANHFEGRDSGPVRAFFLANAIYWMEAFHIDGFRFDATHAIIDESPRHILEEITDAIRWRGGFSIAEDSSNDARLVLGPEHGGMGFDGVWADDFHHVVRVGQTGEDEGYYGAYTGTSEELVDTLRHGWLYRGQVSPLSHRKRGTECRHVPPERFLHCISNHDQVGNRAMGERIHTAISTEAYRAVSALLCLSPYMPMLFMGQEWAASTPFLFFTDHHEELGRLVTKGRRKEFKSFTAFSDPSEREQIPDPQALETFERSRLNWREPGSGQHARVLALYRECLALRSGHEAFRPSSRDSWQVENVAGECGAIAFRGEEQRWLVVFDLKGGHQVRLPEEWIAALQGDARWQFVLSSNEERFGGKGASFDAPLQEANFEFPELIVLTHPGPPS